MTRSTTFALRAIQSGAVWCWGRGEEGQMGTGALDQDNPRAAQAEGITTATQIEAAGTRTTCAVLANHSVRCWGHIASRQYTVPTMVAAFEP